MGTTIAVHENGPHRSLSTTIFLHENGPHTETRTAVILYENGPHRETGKTKPVRTNVTENQRSATLF